MKLTYVVAVATLLSVSAASAGEAAKTEQSTAPVAVPASAKSEAAANPAVELKQGLDTLIQFLRSAPSIAELGTYLEEKIAPGFDFEFMSQASAGPLYRYMEDDQKARLAKKMEVMFLASLAEKLAMYDNQDVAYLPPRRNRRGQVMVSVLVNNPGRYPGRIDFRMHQTKGGWKVYDVVGNGASAIAYYRSYFRKAMR
ncbi:MlaC/ttg2D family ABC transporter substrate-binding protein [Solemya velum gill symbiont]|uniref:MlaC/ttg2D family ABC transporter substrate-binding protein n=1 Tax=Solemya velum gill symbiont TaxID=2340 RepID=UPI0009CEAB6C|nr:ABC transporter substrate-binding protein [Solemya velum gill symbiont]OOZ00561.1 hypothetical protein BOW19_01105 [Solemya velum gill symbiont]OOZ02683.1 hypothetical protein BOW20_01095 [Solemya velum gill symbiont]OOZ04857.1 hypothetical protein BOW21_00015 [Solemya velum gill symbiont]OOZ07098.1 hypothetical protein BOW22_00015 [Solemya velum gill symbiont]OOZ09281.1 hypothetical protein BOW23_00015 [Solemya velum gill symbiont]